MRRLLVALFAVAFALALPAAASAHDVLEKASPADGTAVQTLPGNVVLTFSEEPLAVGAQVLVSGPAGEVQLGTPVVTGRDVTQALSPTAPAGNYTVTYRVTGGDGHPLSGTISFFAATGLDGSTATGVPSETIGAASGPGDEAKESQVVPLLLTITGTCLFLAVGGYLVMRGRGATPAE